MPQLPANSDSETQFAVLSASAVTATVPVVGNSALKLALGPVVLEVTEQTSKALLLQTLGCVKDVFMHADP